MQKKTTDPLAALDRAYREIVPETGGSDLQGAPEETKREPLDLLRSLVADQETQEQSLDASANHPGVAAAVAARTKETLPLDPLEALRILEKALVPENSGDPAAHVNDTPALGVADPLMALKELEQKESGLRAQPVGPASDADDSPVALPPPPPPADVPALFTPKTPGGPPGPGVSKDAPAATNSSTGEKNAREIQAEAYRPVEPKRPEPPPVDPAVTNDIRSGRAMASSRTQTMREQAPSSRSQATGAKSKMRWLGRRRSERETRPAVDPGVAARAAFYQARQELGDDASLDDIIKHACRDLDRPSQEILFEIQLKILLGKSL